MKKLAKIRNLKAEHKFFNRYARICFQNWAYFCLIKTKNLNQAFRIQNRQFRHKLKKSYFRAFLRAFDLNRKIVKFRRTTLQKKVFISFKKKKEFVELKNQMNEICLYKYEDNLKLKSFDILLGYAQKKVQFQSLKKIFELQKNRNLQDKVMRSLSSNRVRRLGKKSEMAKVGMIYKKGLMSKVFDRLKIKASKNRNLRIDAKIVKSKHEKKILKHYMFSMLIKYNKIKLQNQLHLEVKNNQEFRLKKHSFSKWLFRYRYLTQVSKNFIE